MPLWNPTRKRWEPVDAVVIIATSQKQHGEITNSAPGARVLAIVPRSAKNQIGKRDTRKFALTFMQVHETIVGTKLET